MAALVAWAASAGFVSSALAHELRPATLLLKDLGGGAVHFQWTPPRARPDDARRVYPELPQGCRVVSPRRLECSTDELAGRMRIAGLRGRTIEVFVQVIDAAGRRRIEVLNARRDEIELGRAADGPASVWLTYGRLGVEHILSGLDHLLFVLGLILLVGFTRSLVWSVSAFTLAHSATLALSVLDVVRLPSAPVEATIALSIVLVAAESLHDRRTLSRRAPWVVALAFGLLHGLGFAGALRDIGLPDDRLPAALLSFNAGVEVGQIAVIASLYFVWRFLQRRGSSRAAKRTVAYAIGSLGAYWVIERVLAVLC